MRDTDNYSARFNSPVKGSNLCQNSRNVDVSPQNISIRSWSTVSPTRNYFNVLGQQLSQLFDMLSKLLIQQRLVTTVGCFLCNRISQLENNCRMNVLREPRVI